MIVQTVEIYNVHNDLIVATIDVQFEYWMDDTDRLAHTSEQVTIWASDNGYRVDNLDWEYV